MVWRATTTHMVMLVEAIKVAQLLLLLFNFAILGSNLGCNMSRLSNDNFVFRSITTLLVVRGKHILNGHSFPVLQEIRERIGGGGVNRMTFVVSRRGISNDIVV